MKEKINYKSEDILEQGMTLHKLKTLADLEQAISSMENLEFNPSFRKLIDDDVLNNSSDFDSRFVSVVEFLKKVKKKIEGISQ